MVCTCVKDGKCKIPYSTEYTQSELRTRWRVCLWRWNKPKAYPMKQTKKEDALIRIMKSLFLKKEQAQGIKKKLCLQALLFIYSGEFSNNFFLRSFHFFLSYQSSSRPLDIATFFCQLSNFLKALLISFFVGTSVFTQPSASFCH